MIERLMLGYVDTLEKGRERSPLPSQPWSRQNETR